MDKRCWYSAGVVLVALLGCGGESTTRPSSTGAGAVAGFGDHASAGAPASGGSGAGSSSVTDDEGSGNRKSVGGTNSGGTSGSGSAGGSGGSGGSGDVTLPEGGEAPVGGYGGDDGVDEVPRCVPGQSVACACTDGSSGAQTCADDGRYRSCECDETTLAAVRQGIVGYWLGRRTTPWDKAGPLDVQLEFRADGTWAGSTELADEPLFYYGVARATALNTYRLTEVNDDGAAFGRIALTWQYLDEDPYSTEGELRDIALTEDGDALAFEFWATWSGEYGPVKFDLTRRVGGTTRR